MAKARRSEFEQRRFQKLLGRLQEAIYEGRVGEPCPTCGSIIQPRPKPAPKRKRPGRRLDRTFWRDDQGRLVPRPPKRKPERPVEVVKVRHMPEGVTS